MSDFTGGRSDPDRSVLDSASAHKSQPPSSRSEAMQQHGVAPLQCTTVVFACRYD